MSQCTKRHAKGHEITKPYEPTPRERNAIEAFHARRKQIRPSPRLKVSKKRGVVHISTDHADKAFGNALLMEVIGSADLDFVDGLLGQLAKIGITGSEVDESGINFVLSVVKGIEPRDQVEAMLAAQMAVIHNATMTFARRLAHVDTIRQQDSAERALNKLARTFTMQMEALKRYRTGGQQKVIVEHVTVNQGGQAIVGSVTQGGVGDQKNEGSTS